MNLSPQIQPDSPVRGRAAPLRWAEDHGVVIAANDVELTGHFAVPHGLLGTVLLAHPGAIGRHSLEQRFVASVLAQAGLATLVVNLLTQAEERDCAALRADVPLLADRIVAATDWLSTRASTAGLPVGYFSEGVVVAGAVVGAAMRPTVVRAIVSGDGRPDLGGAALMLMQAPTLLVVSGYDARLHAANHGAFERLRGEKHLEVIHPTTHADAGFDRLVSMGRDWFVRHFGQAPRCAAPV